MSSLTPENQKKAIALVGNSCTVISFYEIFKNIQQKVPADMIEQLSQLMDRTFKDVDCGGCLTLPTKSGYKLSFLLDKSTTDHSLDAEINKAYEHCTEEEKKLVIGQLSLLIFAGRKCFENFVKENLIICKSLASYLPNNEFPSIKVDPKNTTLYLHESWPTRVGIYIMVENIIQSKTSEKK